MKKFLKWLAYGATAFIVVLGAVAGLTQTQFFRNALRTFALDQLDSLLIAEVHLGEIRGNLVSGFSIDSVSIKVDSEYFVEAERIDIRYDPFQIPSQKINVSSLVLVRPRIALLCGPDSVWNFERMIRPVPDDSTKTPFDWPIAVHRLEIIEGTFRLKDAASLNETDHVASSSYFVEYHDFAVTDLNLVLANTVVTPTEKRTTIQRLGCISNEPDIILKNLSGSFAVTDKSASVKDLVIETAKSKLRLDASMQDIDILAGIDLFVLKSKPVELSLRTDDLDFAELKRFIHQVDFLHGKVRTLLVVEGEFGKLDVKQLDLDLGSSELHFAGHVANLHNPEKLLLNVQCRSSKVDYGDVLALLPSFDLPDYRSLGRADIDFDFDGEPLNFAANFVARTDAGNVSTTNATLEIGGKGKLRYNGEIRMQGLDLAPLVHNSDMKGRLNGVARIKGSGTSLDNLNATCEVLLDSSLFRGQRLSPSRLSLTSAQRKLSGTVQLTIGSTHADLRAELDWSNKDVPAFKVDGAVSSLNLADYLHDETQTSDLNFSLNTEGSGSAWDKLNAAATLNFDPSRYREYKIDSSRVSVLIDQRDPDQSSISIGSSLADLSIKGKFDLEYIVGLVRYEVDNMSLAVGQRFKSLDSTLASSLDVKEVAAYGSRLSAKNKRLDTEYEFVFKDLEPLSILTGNRTFNAIGTVKGTLQGNFDSLAGSAQLNLQEFFYGNADSGMLVQDGLVSLRFNDLFPQNPLAALTMRLKVDAGKMHINRTKLDTLNFGIFYDKEYAGFTAQADYDRDYHLRTNGQIGVTDDGVQFTMSRLQLSYSDFGWIADDGAAFAVNSNGLRVQNFVVRQDSQSVLVNGSLRTGGVIDGTVSGINLNLGNLKYVLMDEYREGRTGFQGVADVVAHARGTLDEPHYDARLRAHNVSFRGFPFGVIEGDLTYKERLLGARLKIDSRQQLEAGTPDLVVEGTLPINLAIRHEGPRLTDAPMDFTVTSDGLQMSLLDPLVPTFTDVSGLLKTNLKVSGSPRHPVYAGTIQVDDCKFLFVPNNMRYERISAQLRAEGERINVINATVHNVPADTKPGRYGALTIAGDFRFRDLVPSDFNFLINGQLVVVNKDTRTSSLSVFGDLFTEIQSPGLRYTGNIERSLLSGPVLVRNSSLGFPPTSSGARTEAEYSIPTTIIDDTTTHKGDSTQVQKSRYFAMAGLLAQAPLTAQEENSVSFIDGLRYDLGIECAGSNTQIRMVFNAATNEELIANIEGRLTITEDGKTWVGNLDVNRASYNFYGKRFEADGTISYSGDFLNPDLNITAKFFGTRSTGDKGEERVLVIYKISGSRLAPRADISMRIDDVDYGAYNGIKSGDVQSDALTFVITGDFPISRGDANALAGGLNTAVQSTVVGGATSLLTSTFSEFLRNKTGFINSIELGYETGGSGTDKGFGQRADIRLSGTAFKGYWRYGGKILEDPFGNANFSILYSFGDIFDRPLLRNFMFEYERKIVTSTVFGQIETRKDVNSARFFYRFSF